MTSQDHPSMVIAANIIDEFEDILQANGIIIPDEDRPKGNKTPLYGNTYADLQESIAAYIRMKCSSAK